MQRLLNISWNIMSICRVCMYMGMGGELGELQLPVVTGCRAVCSVVDRNSHNSHRPCTIGQAMHWEQFGTSCLPINAIQ